MLNRLYARCKYLIRGEPIDPELAQPVPAPEKPWYFLTYKQTIFITESAKRDFIWPILCTLKSDYRFNPTDNFWQQTWGQQLWCSIAVLATGPVTAYGWAKFYGETFRNSYVWSLVSGLTVISSIIPFNGFTKLGVDFFLDKGFSNSTATYLASLFPGTGTIEGPVETICLAALGKALDPTYSFNTALFIANLSPIAFLSGDGWLVVFNALATIAQKNAGGLLGQAALVCLTELLLNYLTIISTVALSGEMRKCWRYCRTTIDVLRHSGSPVHQAAQPMENAIQDPAPAPRLT